LLHILIILKSICVQKKKGEAWGKEQYQQQLQQQQLEQKQQENASPEEAAAERPPTGGWDKVQVKRDKSDEFLLCCVVNQLLI
jgi:hypothetical protein